MACLALSSPSIFASTTSLSTTTISPNEVPNAVSLDSTTNTQHKYVASTNTHATSGGVWQQIGSGQINVPTQLGSHVSGRVTSIAISQSSNGKTIFLGSAQGGVWTSTNDGSSWTPATSGEQSLSTGSVAVDPNNPNTIYVGTGEENFSQDSRYGKGILKSTDGGKTWTLLASAEDIFGGDHIGKIAVDPFDSNNIWVAANSGLWESTDGGQTWNQMYAGQYDIWPGAHVECPVDVYLDSKTPGVIYASTQGGGLLKSTDGGQTFDFMGVGMGDQGLPNWTMYVDPSGSQNMFLASFAVVEGGSSGPDTLYTSYSDTNGELMGMFVSKDGGDTWAKLSNVPQYFDYGYADNGVYDPNHAAGSGWFDNVIAVDPTNPNHILAGGSTLIESRDGGQTWTDIDAFFNKSKTPVANIYPSQHAITFDAQGDAYIGNDGGIFEETAAGTWKNLNSASLNTTMLTAGVTTSKRGQIVMAGSAGTGSLLYNSSTGWNQVYFGIGGYTYVDAKNPSSMFAESGNVIVRTSDGGNSWVSWRPDNLGPVEQYVPFTVNPVNAGKDEVFVGSNPVSKMSTDGSTYTSISKVLMADPLHFDRVSTMSQSTSDPNVMYVGTWDGHVWATFNAEAQYPIWTDISPDSVNTNDNSSPALGNEVTKIAINPNNDKQVTVTYGVPGAYEAPWFPKHVFSCSDTSVSSLTKPNCWTDTTGNLPNAYVDSAVDNGTMTFVGTDQGVYAALDGSSKWVQVGSGIPDVDVTSLVTTDDGQLIAGTMGRGAFTFDLKSNQKSLQALLSN